MGRLIDTIKRCPVTGEKAAGRKLATYEIGYA